MIRHVSTWDSPVSPLSLDFLTGFHEFLYCRRTSQDEDLKEKFHRMECRVLVSQNN